MPRPVSLIILAAALLQCTPAHAQRTTANAVTQAEDAFGSRWGNEAVGLYDPYDTRGFSPVEAGNVRIEGLYFDQASNPTDRLIFSSTVHVGVTALGYAFPAPTGIADYKLRSAGPRALLSTYLTTGPKGGATLENDAQLPVSSTLGLAGGVGFNRSVSGHGQTSKIVSGALIATWRPSPHVELRSFWSRIHYSSDEPQPSFFPADPASPPHPPRGIFLGPDFLEGRGSNYNWGALGRASIDDWLLEAGIFRSTWRSDRSFSVLLMNANDAFADETIIASPRSFVHSVSGEIRATRRIADGERTHFLLFDLQGRTRQRSFGGDDSIEIGEVPLDRKLSLSEPAIDFAPQTRDRINQASEGLSYRLDWPRLGEFSLGLRHVSYRKSTIAPGSPAVTSRDSPWLWNIGASFNLSGRLTAYLAATHGLEESPQAPPVASNRAEAPRAVLSRQKEAGIRWLAPAGLKVIAGAFDLSKPYFGLDANNLFVSLGQLRNRGVELSLSGTPLPRLNLIAGFLLLDASVSGPQGTAPPVGSAKGTLSVNADYDLGRGRSLSLGLGGHSGAFVDSAVPRAAGQLLVSVGARQLFKLGKTRASARLVVSNLLDSYRYTVGSDGSFTYVDPRRLTFNLGADF